MHEHDKDPFVSRIQSRGLPSIPLHIMQLKGMHISHHHRHSEIRRIWMQDKKNMCSRVQNFNGERVKQIVRDVVDIVVVKAPIRPRVDD